MKQLFTLTFILSTICCFSQSDISKQLTSFAKENYKIQYPSDWSIDTLKKMGADIFIFSPKENENDKFRENVNLFVQDLTGLNIDLDKYAKTTEGQIKEMVTEGIIYESKKVTQTGRPEYYKMVYGMTQGIFKLKIEQYYFIKEDIAYVITFTAELNKFESYQNVGEQILNSFILIK
jgi:hypothetical protein